MRTWTLMHTVSLILIVVAVPLASWGLVANGTPLTAWFVTLALLAAFILIAGHGVLGVWRGLLIDDRNVISLSRFQLVIWTVIVLSAFLTAALWNCFVGLEEPLAIGIPGTLWALMGISTTSFVGTPLILNTKKKGSPAPQALNETRNQLQLQGQNIAKVTHTGLVIRNTTPTAAMWNDMFTGDEVINGAHLDLGKIQMFFFTIIVAFAYCVALFRMFAANDASGFNAFPALDESALALIGISHAGYLVNKGIPH